MKSQPSLAPTLYYFYLSLNWKIHLHGVLKSFKNAQPKPYFIFRYLPEFYHNNSQFFLLHFSSYLGRVKRIWYLSPMRAAKVQASLRIRAVSPEPPLFAHTNSESRGTFRQKTRSLALLSCWACAVKVCHDGMLEDTNSLGAAHFTTLVEPFDMRHTIKAKCQRLFVHQQLCGPKIRNKYLVSCILLHLLACFGFEFNVSDSLLS